MQEVQMLLILVENIVDNLLLIPAHHIIILTTFLEVDNSTVIFLQPFRP